MVLIAIIEAITSLAWPILAAVVVAGSWKAGIFHAVAGILEKAKQWEFELEYGKVKVRNYIETREEHGQRRLLPATALAYISTAVGTPASGGTDSSVQQLLELREHCRQSLIGLTGVEGKGHQASLRKLALHAATKNLISEQQADELIQLDAIADLGLHGRISEGGAKAVVTVSGTLLDSAQPGTAPAAPKLTDDDETQ